MKTEDWILCESEVEWRPALAGNYFLSILLWAQVHTITLSTPGFLSLFTEALQASGSRLCLLLLAMDGGRTDL